MHSFFDQLKEYDDKPDMNSRTCPLFGPLILDIVVA